MMTHLSGWAWSPDETERRNAAHARLSHLRSSGRSVIIMARESKYGRVTYRGTADADLSDSDIALLCDGNPCFGAEVSRAAGAFTCVVLTD